MKKLAVLLALVVCAAPAFAGDTGILKLSLWGKKLVLATPANTQEITGIDFGIGSESASVTGVQLDLVYGQADKVKGVQSAIVTRSNDLVGAQFGVVGFSHDLVGAQLGYVNFSDSYVKGVQFGLYNQAEELHGVQLGFVNNVKTINGLQIGLVNFAKNGWFPVMVLVNGRF